MGHKPLLLRTSRAGRFCAVCVMFLLMIGSAACQPVQAPQANPPDVVIEASTEAVADVLVQAQVLMTKTQMIPVAAPIADTEVTTEVTPLTAEAASADPALLAAGVDVYHQQYCGVCHTLAAAETTGTFGPAHDGLGAVAEQRLLDPNYQGQATTAAEYIHESIVDPTAYIVPGYATTSHRMPAYVHLQGTTLDALVAFLAAQ